MEADETLIVAELVPGSSKGVRETSLKCKTGRGKARWPALLPLQFNVRLLPVGLRERDLNNPALWQMLMEAGPPSIN